MMRRTVKLLVSALLWSPRPGARALSMNYEFVLCAAAAEKFFTQRFFGIICIFFLRFAMLPPTPLKFVVGFILRRDKNYVQNVLSHVWL